MRALIAAAVLAAASLSGGSAWAQAVEVANVKYEPSVDLAGQKLVLNGAGIRYKFVVKVYTAGLYLAAKAATVALMPRCMPAARIRRAQPRPVTISLAFMTACIPV